MTCDRCRITQANHEKTGVSTRSLVAPILTREHSKRGTDMGSRLAFQGDGNRGGIGGGGERSWIRGVAKSLKSRGTFDQEGTQQWLRVGSRRAYSRGVFDEEGAQQWLGLVDDDHKFVRPGTVHHFFRFSVGTVHHFF